MCQNFNFLFTLLLQILDDDLSLGLHQHKSVFKTNCTNGIAKTIYFIQITRTVDKHSVHFRQGLFILTFLVGIGSSLIALFLATAEICTQPLHTYLHRWLKQKFQLIRHDCFLFSITNLNIERKIIEKLCLVSKLQQKLLPCPYLPTYLDASSASSNY